MGLAFAVYPPETLFANALAYAEKLAQLPISSLVATKQLMLAANRPELAVTQAHMREMKVFDTLLDGPANREALQAFAQRRAADFSKL